MPHGHHARRSARRHGWLLLSALLLLILGLSADPARAEQTPPGGSWVRAAHLLPGMQPMQVILEPADDAAGTPITLSPGLSYGDATEYRTLALGNYTVTVRPLAASTSAPPVLSSTYTAAAGKAFTLGILGTLAAPRLAVLQDDLTLPAAGLARVRVLPVASQATQVTVQAAGGPTLATGAVFGQPTPYASAPAGNWRLSATTPAGRPTGASTVTLASGAVYTLLVVDGEPGILQLTTLQDAAGARMAPGGGVATGGGGTAPGNGGSGPLGARTVGLAVLLALVGTLVLRAGRRGSAVLRLRSRP